MESKPIEILITDSKEIEILMATEWSKAPIRGGQQIFRIVLARWWKGDRVEYASWKQNKDETKIRLVEGQYFTNPSFAEAHFNATRVDYAKTDPRECGHFKDYPYSFPV